MFNGITDAIEALQKQKYEQAQLILIRAQQDADGAYNATEAAIDHNLHILGLRTDNMLELTYAERKRVHKYEQAQLILIRAQQDAEEMYLADGDEGR